MSLNLGLESLGVSVDDVSFESVLSAQVEVMEARASFEHVVFDLAATARNVHNFNEIVGSLKKHSSAECAEFAQDLLGIPSVEAAEAASVPPAKVEAANKSANTWWEKIKAWVKSCYEWVKKQINKVLTALKLKSELTRNPKVKVHWTLADIEKGANELSKVSTNAKDARLLLKSRFLSEKPKGYTLDTSDDLEAAKYLNRLTDIQKSLYHITTSFRLSTTAETSGMQLTTQTAILKRIQTVQKYVLADVKAISDASAATAGKITKKVGDVKKQNAKLTKKIEDNKKIDL